MRLNGAAWKWSGMLCRPKYASHSVFSICNRRKVLYAKKLTRANVLSEPYLAEHAFRFIYSRSVSANLDFSAPIIKAPMACIVPITNESIRDPMLVQIEK